MKHIYYCTYCEQDVNYICVNNIDETYKNYDTDDNLISIEYRGQVVGELRISNIT
jgi:hypothetical protein